MLKKLNDLLAGVPMTLVGLLFLVMSFVFPLVGIASPVDPAWVTVFISGIPLLYLALWRIVYNPGIKKISSALLIVIAMFAAICIGDLFAAGEVAFIMSIGAILEEMTTQRAKKGLTKLLSLTPAQGRLLIDGKETMVATEEIRLDHVLRVLPGETIPVDGVIISGETSVDQSIMTGESLPVDKETGDDVFCGTINRFGSIDIRATKVGADSSLQRLIQMVVEAEEKQAPMQRIADKCASWLVPVALLIAIISYIVTKDIVVSVTVLVVFCPCALVLATPTAVIAAIGQATKHGVIIKSGEALERMGKVDTIAFDKTGTLTYGKLTVGDVIPLTPDYDEATILTLSASVEQKSEHPLGKAIVAYAKAQGIQYPDCTHFNMSVGKGISATIDTDVFFCGNEKFLNLNNIHLNETATAHLASIQHDGKAAVLLAKGSDCIGLISLSDTLREEAPAVMKRLHSLNTNTVLLTGDNKKTATYFASQAGISEIRTDLLPEEKVANIVALQDSRCIVCMVGDGVNDAPALKTADVGIAMGSMGSDIAVDAADIALMSDDISKLPYLKRLSTAAVNTIKLSITLSMCINFLAIILSLMKVLTPTTGALVHNAGSCLVVLIAALLYDRKFD